MYYKIQEVRKSKGDREAVRDLPQMSGEERVTGRIRHHALEQRELRRSHWIC